MSTSISTSLTSTYTIDKLDAAFQTAINTIITAEKQPLDKITTQRDEVLVKKGVYQDIRTSMEDLLSYVQSMNSSNGSAALDVLRKTTVSNAPTGSTVLSASANSDATNGTYSIEVQQLAKEAIQETSSLAGSPTEVLNRSGNLVINGATISVVNSYSTNDIASLINNATFTSGERVTAKVVNNKLVLSSFGSINLTDNISNGGLGFTQTQSYQNSIIKVGGATVTRSSNTITDAIYGVTLNLQTDAEGKTVSLNVAADFSRADSSLDGLLSKLNSTISIIGQKTGVTSSKSGDKTIYTRGTLASDFSIKSLRSDLANTMLNSTINSGKYHNMAEIGLTVGDNSTFTVDRAKFEAALNEHSSDVETIVQATMDKMETVISNYTGTSGYLYKSITGIEDQVASFNSQINSKTDLINTRKQNLINQYAYVQAQLVEMNNTSKQMFGKEVYDL